MLDFPPWKIITVLGICFLGLLAALPNFLSERQIAALPDFLPQQQVNLGLDLQGGSHMLLEVDTEAVIQERLEALVDDVRTTLRANRIGYRGLRVDDQRVIFELRNPADQDQAIDEVRDLAQPITSNVFSTGQTDLTANRISDTRVEVRLTDEGLAERRRGAVLQSLEIVRKRVDELGTREPTIQLQGQERIILQVPGLQNPGQLREILNTTAKMTFHMVDSTTSAAEAQSGRIPPGSMILPMADGTGEIVVRKRSLVSGENLVDAQPSFDQNGQPVVTFRFDGPGSRRFGEVTSNNVGRPFAIVLDDEVLSAPVIREPILGGSGQIAGNFTVQSANELAVLLRAGALPAPLTILEERTVGPGLGADSVAAGKLAAVIGLAAVIVYMILSYGLFGIAANTALAINILLIFGVLSTLQATLTLPGIAGIVLTVGMAVDANVLVFERIREEMFAGKSPFNAVDSGYRQALSTILDANITTLIAAVLLFQFGSGPVRGFAVTLGVGIITSVFTAFVVSRLFITLYLRRRRPAALPI